MILTIPAMESSSDTARGKGPGPGSAHEPQENCRASAKPKVPMKKNMKPATRCLPISSPPLNPLPPGEGKIDFLYEGI
ncbi:MAG TPA: hypothetical protein DCZ97_16635 [Syntrophus sp. (in: bacteria)]|nr:hypothetical protein [Syntrophus sp. (in: bacteria)]